MEGDGSVVAVASDGDTKELSKGGGGEFLYARFQVGFQIVEDEWVGTGGEEVIDVESDVDLIGGVGEV